VSTPVPVRPAGVRCYNSGVATTYPPAWYPDPYRAGQLRRWDGKSWTNEVRSVPPWLATVRFAPGPPPRRLRVRDRPTLARRLWSASALTLVFALLLALSLPAALRTADEERVGDPRFLAAASSLCDEANRSGLRAFRTGDRSDPDALATALERLVDELRAVDVSSDDRERVDAWIDRWERLAATGHRYADAVEYGDDERAGRLNDENLVTRAQINRFAYANGLTACVL